MNVLQNSAVTTYSQNTKPRILVLQQAIYATNPIKNTLIAEPESENSLECNFRAIKFL